MKIIKSFRKTITLRVDKNGELIVKTPYLTSKKTILSFVEKHKDWIERKQKEISKNKKNFNE
ncbi:MAG: M48 family metallopeptidase [Candidatus Peribacteria bacterium]|jgi:predicted metal-dependent hydrolase|nr:M48 family metallopeptidase [Candidatus Peribacteria bacterium]